MTTTREIGSRVWAIADGYIPPSSTGPEPEMLSHETASFLNASADDAEVQITIFFSDRAPVGPYRLTVAAPLLAGLHLDEAGAAALRASASDEVRSFLDTLTPPASPDERAICSPVKASWRLCSERATRLLSGGA